MRLQSGRYLSRYGVVTGGGSDVTGITGASWLGACACIVSCTNRFLLMGKHILTLDSMLVSDVHVCGECVQCVFCGWFVHA